MKIHLENPKEFKALFKGLDKVLDEGEFHVTPDGISFWNLDPAHVAGVQLNIHAEAFDTYEVKEQYVLGLDISWVKEVMEKQKAGESMTIELVGDAGPLKISFKKGRRRSFKIPLISAAQIEHGLPDVPRVAIAEFESTEFVDSIKDTWGERIDFHVSEEGIGIKGEKMGGELKSHVIFSPDDMVSFKPPKEPLVAMYSEEYLADVRELLGMSETVRVEFTEDGPIYLVFGTDMVDMVVAIAPRMDKDE